MASDANGRGATNEVMVETSETGGIGCGSLARTGGRSEGSEIPNVATGIDFYTARHGFLAYTSEAARTEQAAEGAQAGAPNAMRE